MPRQYSHDFVFERDFPENVKTIFFNGTNLDIDSCRYFDHCRSYSKSPGLSHP